jgi:hypothetical protein
LFVTKHPLSKLVCSTCANKFRKPKRGRLLSKNTL